MENYAKLQKAAKQKQNSTNVPHLKPKSKAKAKLDNFEYNMQKSHYILWRTLSKTKKGGNRKCKHLIDISDAAHFGNLHQTHTDPLTIFYNLAIYVL